MLVSFTTKCEKPTTKTKQVYDYTNADINGLITHIKVFDFQKAVFNYPAINQAELYSNALADAFHQFIPIKNVQIRPNDQPWTNSYTRLLFRKKNRNYQIYKKASNEYNKMLSDNNSSQTILTKYLNKKKKTRLGYFNVTTIGLS